MKLILEKDHLALLHKNGFLAQDQVGIVWDQLTQTCNQLQHSSLSLQASQIKNEILVPNVQGSLLGEPIIHDICISFSFKNGATLARSLQSRMLQKKKMVILCSETASFDPLDFEKRIATSSALVVLLTRDCLKQVEVIFSLLVAKFYYQHPSLVILVHEAESCYFPAYDEQPESVRDFFSEKAITFLSCYAEEGVKEMLTKFDSELNALENIHENFRQNPTEALLEFLAKNERRKVPMKEIRSRMKLYMTSQQLDDFEVRADKNKDGILDSEEVQNLINELKRREEVSEAESSEHDEPIMEDLTTRVFLSHKRSTGQGIAGRLYEGLKKSYTVFIDSEAKFKIHNLKLIVQNTDAFVFILSYGIFLSKWCLEELKSAIENKKRVIVVRELSFQYPDVLPDEWLEVEPVLKNSKELIWIAEYNTACVHALHKFIGSPDERHKPAVKYFSSKEGKVTLNSILNKFQSTNILDLNRAIALPSTVEVDAVLDFVLESIPAEKIHIVHITSKAETNGGVNDPILTGVFERLPNIQELSLAGSTGLVTNTVVENLCACCPKLRKLDLEQCVLLTGEGLKPLKDLDSLIYLNLDKISELKDDAIEIIASSCPKLEVLKIGFANFTHKAFEQVAKISTLKELVFPYLLKNLEDAKKFKAKHPSVNILMEPTVLDFNFRGQWYPAIIKSYTTSEMNIHCYGKNANFDRSISISELTQTTAAFGTHNHEYAKSDNNHASSDCVLCESLHETLRHAKFGGKPNAHFINDWYYSEPEGLQEIKPYHDQAEKGQLQLGHYDIPNGIKLATFTKAILDKYPAERIKELYLQPYSTEHLLSYHRNEDELSEFQPIAEALPPQLEELDFHGNLSDQCAELLATKIPHVTALHLSNLEISEKGLLALFRPHNKLRVVTIRNCKTITADMLFKIAQNCQHVADLNLTLNPGLVNQKDDVILHLTKNFPSLKKLVIDPPILKSPKFEEFKNARPNISVEFESLYLRDIDFGVSTATYYPAIQIEGMRGPKSTEIYHLYGTGRELTINLSNQREVNKVKPFLSSSKYGPQDSHTDQECFYCSLMHSYCENLHFQGERNKFFENYWFFDEEEGKTLLQKFMPKENEPTKIIFNTSLPSGIKEWGIVHALSKQLDLQKSYTLCFAYSIPDLTRVLEQPLPISGVELCDYSFIWALQWISEKAPKLTRLVVDKGRSFGEEHWEALNLPDLQYLDVGGCATLMGKGVEGIAKSTKLTYLNLSQTGITDESLQTLAKNWTKMTSLNLRMLPITEKSVALVCQNCPELESLNLIMCTKVLATACKIIQEKVSKLKELKLPFHWVGTEALAQLKSARPNITYIEKSELVDAKNSGTWYPAVILNQVRNTYKVHFYGLDGDAELIVTDPSELFAPIFTYQDKYGQQQRIHFEGHCEYCEMLNPMCHNIQFGGSKNYAFVNDWFFDTTEGKLLVEQIANQTTNTGKLEIGINTPPGLRFENIIRAVLKSIPSPAVRHIVFTDEVSPGALQDFLSDKPSLLSLSFLAPFKDEHMAIVASKCQTLTNLTLFACDVTSAGLEQLANKITNLETLSLKFCKNITDKGVEALLLANKTLNEVQLSFQHQLTGASVRVLAKLPRLQTATLCYKLGHKEIIQESNALKKKMPLLEISRGEIVFDFSDPYGDWLPAFATEFDEAKKGFKAHVYGWEERWMEESAIATRVAEPFTHSYSSVSYHIKEQCSLCQQLHSYCKKYTFGGKRLASHLV